MDRSIRFINSQYEDKFKLPDGGILEVVYADRMFAVKCEYVDDYHMRLGNDVYHICQFAEMLERGGGSCKPEDIIRDYDAAWDIAKKGYLMIQTSDEGYDYTLYDHEFNEIDGGQIDDVESSMNAVRNEILADIGWDKQTMTRVDYENLMDRIEENESAIFAKKRVSALEQLNGLKGIGSDALVGKQKQEVER